jgi:hypothetical protein
MDKMTEFILVKDNLTTRTVSLLAVSYLKSKGWKVKQSSFSNLI